MSSLPSNVAAHASATSATDPTVWFHQRACNTCPSWILTEKGLSATMGQSIWNHVELLLPCFHHASHTNASCVETGPPAVLCNNLHCRRIGTQESLLLVGATIEVVYISTSQMTMLHACGAHHVPFVQDPQWPDYEICNRHLTRTHPHTSNLAPPQGTASQ